MKLIERVTSREQCAEAGWFAFDYLLDEAIDKNFVLSLRPLGSFLFIEQLSKPFFKVESDHYIIKGLLNDDFFRIAVHKDHYNELEKIEQLLGFH